MDVDVHGLKKGGVRGGGGKVSGEGVCMCKEFSQACQEVSGQCSYSIYTFKIHKHDIVMYTYTL